MNRPAKYGLTLVFIIGAFNFLMVASFLYFGTLTSNDKWLRLFWMGIGSIISAAITVAVVFYTTPILRDFLVTFRRLLRFDSLSNPLLVRLSTEAPGTYHHSLMIANLAHRVAKQVGADPLLARIGAYYHDIGKLSNPELFVENQPSGTHPPEPKDYAKAAQAIKAHVSEGLKLAKTYNLPPEVSTFIPQTHGTTFARYFYDKAKEKGIKLNDDDFAYDGPKPMSVETAIVMLADIIEARARNMEDFNREKLTKLVGEAIAERESEDQFELVQLTPKQLGKMRDAFVDALLVMHHRRIKYPADLKAEQNPSHK